MCLTWIKVPHGQEEICIWGLKRLTVASSTYFSRTIKAILDHDSEDLLDVPYTQRPQIYSNALNCLGLLPFLLLFLLLDSRNLIRAYYKIERKTERLKLYFQRSILPPSVAWWPIEPVPGRILKDAAYAHGLPLSRAREAKQLINFAKWSCVPLSKEVPRFPESCSLLCYVGGFLFRLSTHIKWFWHRVTALLLDVALIHLRTKNKNQ